MKMNFKRLLMLLISLLAVACCAFLLVSCLEVDEGGFGNIGGDADDEDDGEGNGNENIWEGISYSFSIKFMVPDSDKVYTAGGYREETKVTIEFTEVALKNHSTYAQLRKDSGFVKYGEYLGLYNAPEGGQRCYDTEGNNLGIFSDNGMYYAQFKREYNIVYEGLNSSMDYELYNLPKTISHGQELGIASLPVPENNAKDFIGWYCQELMAYVTDKDGVFLSGYSLVDEKYDKAQNKLTFRARFKEYTRQITFDYNDGTYRISTQSYPLGTPASHIYYPITSGELREVIGWSTSPYELTPFSGELTEDITLYAIWREYRYVVLVYAPGEEDVVKIVDGELYTIPDPKKDGYVFNGWYSNELKTGLPIPSTVRYGDPYEYYYASWSEA